MEVLAQFIVDLLRELWPFEVIQPWEGGVRTTFGRRPRALKPGVRMAIPFMHVVTTEPITEQIVSATVQSVQSLDGVPFLFSLQIRYRVADVLATLLNVHEYEDTLDNLAEGEAATYISETYSQDITREGLCEAVLESIEEATGDWGLCVYEITCQDFSRHKVTRWVQ